MQINILFFGKFRELTGIKQNMFVVKDGSSLGELILYLNSKYGNRFQDEITNISGLRILIDGKENELIGGLDAILEDGSTVVFLPPVVGG